MADTGYMEATTCTPAPVRVRDVTGRLGTVDPAMVDLTGPTPAAVPVRFEGLTGYVMTKPALLEVLP